MAKYKTGINEKAKCVYKETKEGKRGSLVGCNRNEIKNYFKGLYETNAKTAKDELKAVMEAFEIGKKRQLKENELKEIMDQVYNAYDTMNYDIYDEKINEIEKMHNEMKQIYSEIAKLNK
jgi:uncharacterized protein YpuA (DUF1002 family)